MKDEDEIICWHNDHGKTWWVKGINLVKALYHSKGVLIPVVFEVVHKPHREKRQAI
ncbi:hypothetical protein METHB2_140003 [Candidatus Methylobacter favarea]|uniref:Uncharacterized protein n=1 Tax=Candidatus Methylobacter favarea TaxID=2707345 RepID=A0A8S0Y992_9GAMM|nr:hypothetical protein [Candidatus Methylobacter favarea]CAA9889816.1 hypothetical protein METHB2_140003 [Candidatus Methylobacter favarea]